jgi:hypothetical protein
MRVPCPAVVAQLPEGIDQLRHRDRESKNAHLDVARAELTGCVQDDPAQHVRRRLALPAGRNQSVVNSSSR